MKSNFIYTYIYKSLIKKYKHKDEPWWQKRWKKYILKDNSITISTRIHNYEVLVNNGFTYPLYTRLIPTLNNPLLELCYQVFLSKNRKINIIDVGAAIGDTYLFIKANIPECIDTFYCIDGDEVFFEYLTHNLKSFSDVVLIKTLLSEKNEAIQELVRIHSGTASAQGEKKITANTLDNVMKVQKNQIIDVIKIDVDGFDGKVIKGAENILVTQKPPIIFEWHPILYENTGNDIFEPFDFLNSVSYTHFLFYSNFGDFCAFHQSPIQKSDLERYIKIVQNDKHSSGWHYDIIALHKDTIIDIDALAIMKNAKNKKSQY